MKKILFPIFLLAVCMANAQTATVTLSKEFVLKDRGLSNSTGTTFKLGDYYYSVEYDYKSMMFAYTAKLDKIKYGINVYKYNADMKEISKIKLNKGEKEYGPFPPQALIQNDKLLLFYYQAQEDNSIKLRVTIFDPETLTETATNDLYTLTERNVGLFNLANAMGSNKLALVRSADQKELLVSQSGNTNEIFTCILNSNNEVTKSTTSPINKTLKDFSLQNLFLDNAENKYFTYTYGLNKLNKRGILVQNNKGKEAYLDFNTGQAQWESNKLNFCASNDNSTLYVYANYYGNYMDEGVLLGSINAEKLTFGNVQLFPYTDDIKEKMNKLGFGSSNKGSITVNRIDYVSTVLEDGTIAMSGYPTYSHTSTFTTGGGTTAIGTSIPMSTNSVTNSAAGPIINIFIKDGHCSFGLLYRKEAATQASGFIIMPYQNNLLCIYSDSKKNLEKGDADDVKNVGSAKYLVLVEAVIGSDGTVLSRKEIGGDPVGSNYYYIDNFQYLSKGSYLIPIGRERTSMTRYYTEIVQWAKVDIE